MAYLAAAGRDAASAAGLPIWPRFRRCRLRFIAAMITRPAASMSAVFADVFAAFRASPAAPDMPA